MATTQSTYTGNGSTVLYSFTFPYLDQSHVKVTLDEVATTAFTFANATQIQFTTAPASGVDIRIFRETDVDSAEATYFAGSSIRHDALNDNQLQALYSAQEMENNKWGKNSETIDSGETWSASDTKIATTAAVNDRIGGLINSNINGGTGLTVQQNTPSTGQININLDNTAVTPGSYTVSAITVDAQGRITAASSGQVTATQIATGAVTSDKILDGTIVNADISSSAAIDGSKLDVELNDLSNVSVASPSLNELLKWNGTNWVPGSVSGTGTVTSVDTGTGLTGGPITAGGTISLANTAVTAGSYTAADITVDAQGRITAASNGSINVVSDTTPQLGGNLDVQANEINTSTTNGNIKLNPNGTGVVEVKGAGGNDGVLQLNCSANSHGVKIKSPPHSAAASYTLTLPNDDGNANQVLKTDGSGVLSWTNQSSDVVNDTTPQLGGDLDVNTYSIVSTSNGDITLNPNGTGDILLDANVGVGTPLSGPTNQLHIYDNTAANDRAELKIEAFRPGIRLQDRSSSSSSAEIVGDNALIFRVSAPVDDDTALTERLRIASDGVVTVKNGAVAEIDTLTSGTTITPDFAASCNFTVTLGHNATIANPSNLTAGQSGSIFLVQDGTGSRTAAFGSYWDFAGGSAPTLTTNASSVDRIDYIVRSSTSIHAVATLNYS